MNELQNSFTAELDGIKVLIAEDEPGIQELYREHLEMSGCEISVANNGREAVNLMKNNDFDLLITDLNMSDYTGYELLTDLNKLKMARNGQYFTIVVSGEPRVLDSTLKALGVNKIKSKPIDMSDLLIDIKQLFSAH